MDQKNIIILGLIMIVPIMGLFSSFTFGRNYTLIAIFLSMITIATVFLLNFADFFVLPLVTRILGMTFRPYPEYKISKRVDATIKEYNGLFYATGYLAANVFAYSFNMEHMAEGEEEHMEKSVDAWERAVMSIDFPFKYHILSCGRDSQKVREDLEGRRSYREFELNRANQSDNPNSSLISEIERKINVLQTRMDRISLGDKPVSVLQYMETTSVGLTEKEALDTLNYQINSIKNAFNFLDLSLIRVSGRELYTLFKFATSLPTTLEELKYEFDEQGQ